MKTKIIGVVSFKGGVGKTISAINIAAALTKRGKKVLIIDSNFLSPTLHVYSGLLDPDVTLKEVLFNGASIHDAIYRHESGIHIIPCLFCKEVNPRGFLENINKIKNHYDFIILDAGTSYNEEILPVFHASDELIFITTPDYPTLSTTSKIAEIALDKQKKVRGVLINRQRDKSFELTAKDIEYTLGLKL
jgi:septum site-determining protein MinD